MHGGEYSIITRRPGQGPATTGCRGRRAAGSQASGSGPVHCFFTDHGVYYCFPHQRRFAMTSTLKPPATAKLPAGAAAYKMHHPDPGPVRQLDRRRVRRPGRGQYFTNPTPITGQPLCEVARSTHEDVDKALDAAHAAAHELEPHLRRPTAPTSSTGSPTGWSRISRPSRFIETHRQRQADPRDDARRPAAGGRSLPLLRRRAPGPGGRHLARSTRTPSPITSTSRWASSARSSPGTSRC